MGRANSVISTLSGRASLGPEASLHPVSTQAFSLSNAETEQIKVQTLSQGLCHLAGGCNYLPIAPP